MEGDIERCIALHGPRRTKSWDLLPAADAASLVGALLLLAAIAWMLAFDPASAESGVFPFQYMHLVLPIPAAVISWLALRASRPALALHREVDRPRVEGTRLTWRPSRRRTVVIDLARPYTLCRTLADTHPPTWAVRQGLRRIVIDHRLPEAEQLVRGVLGEDAWTPVHAAPCERPAGDDEAESDATATPARSARPDAAPWIANTRAEPRAGFGDVVPVRDACTFLALVMLALDWRLAAGAIVLFSLHDRSRFLEGELAASRRAPVTDDGILRGSSALERVVAIDLNRAHWLARCYDSSPPQWTVRQGTRQILIDHRLPEAEHMVSRALGEAAWRDAAAKIAPLFERSRAWRCEPATPRLATFGKLLAAWTAAMMLLLPPRLAGMQPEALPLFDEIFGLTALLLVGAIALDGLLRARGRTRAEAIEGMELVGRDGSRIDLRHPHAVRRYVLGFDDCEVEQAGVRMSVGKRLRDSEGDAFEALLLRASPTAAEHAAPIPRETLPDPDS